MEKKGRGRGRGRGNFRNNIDQREDDIQRELNKLTLSNDNAAQKDFETFKSNFDDDVAASVFSATAAAAQQEGSQDQDEPEVLQAEFVEKSPGTIGVQTEGASASEVISEDYVPSNLIDAATEFRAHASPGLNRISRHFFCTICGCPAGRDCWLCRKRGHLVCKQCKEELNNLTECLYVLQLEPGCLCNSKLVKLKSPIGKGIFEITTVNCQYRYNGCRTEGPWKVVKKHQKTCSFAEKVTRTSKMN